MVSNAAALVAILYCTEKRGVVMSLGLVLAFMPPFALRCFFSRCRYNPFESFVDRC